MVGRLVDMATQRWQHAMMALFLGAAHLAGGALTQPLHALVFGTARQSGLDGRGRSALLSVATGVQWPQQRLFEVGLVLDGACLRCEGATGTLRHRSAGCPATAVSRTQWLAEEVEVACPRRGRRPVLLGSGHRAAPRALGPPACHRVPARLDCVASRRDAVG